MGKFSTLLFVAVFSTLVVGAFASGQSAVLPQAQVAGGQLVYTGMLGWVSTDVPVSFSLMLPGQHGHRTLNVNVTDDTVYWVGGHQPGTVRDLETAPIGARVVVQLTAPASTDATGQLTGIAAVVEIIPPRPNQSQ